ncbi:LOW QUALITY PROTEIN: tetrathionate reductase two-component response regulator [Vibrio sp. JCM 18904]|nr:LOW QUALITY PROTEIN: tetrathionate reductase two-component response regulator [Vibrio sp. JCM 18904]
MSSGEKQLPVFVVDDDESVRDSLAFMLEEHEFKVTTFADGQSFLDEVNIHQAGCVILDSRMPNLRGQQVHQILNQPTARPLFIQGMVMFRWRSMHCKLGAVNFFQKPVKGDELARAILQGQAQSATNLDMAAAKSAYESLTPREKDILRLIIEGKRNIRIADELCIAMRTVEVHRANLLKKFSAKTVAELAYIYGKLD